MFRRLRENGKRGMGIVEYAILIAVIATVASRAYPFLVQHLLGNTQRQVQSMPAYSDQAFSESSESQNIQSVVELQEFNLFDPSTWDSIFHEQTKSATYVHSKENKASWQTGPGTQRITDKGFKLSDVDTGVGLDKAAVAGAGGGPGGGG